MPMRLQSVPAANNRWSYIQAMVEPENTELWSPTWTYQRGVPKTRQTEHWTHGAGYWPRRSGFTSDPAAPVSLIQSRDHGFTVGSFEPNAGGFGGAQSLKFITGRCVDADSNPVPNAVVQGFLTSTDEFQRETVATDQGYYELGTDKAGQGHYLVAYKAGSPDIAGTTVNTLVPTNRDGT